MLGAIWETLAGLATWLGIRERRAEEADDMEAGATAQREADQRAELEKRNEQLRDAVDHRPDDWRDASDDGRF